MQHKVSSRERSRSFGEDHSRSNDSTSSSSPVSPRLDSVEGAEVAGETANVSGGIVALNALALKNYEAQKRSPDFGDVVGGHEPDGDQVSVLIDSHDDPNSPIVPNRRVEVKLPTGEIVSAVVCPFDDRVHYVPADLELTSMTSQELSESEDVLSQDFAELSFISRILSMSLDPEVPVLERFKFLCTVSMNLDEHFTKRLSNISNLDPYDLEMFSHTVRHQVRPKTQYESRLTAAIQAIVDMQYQCLENDLLPQPKSHGIEIVKYDRLSRHQKATLGEYFDKKLRPAMAPIVLDLTHPFPLLQSHDLYLVAVVSKPLADMDRDVLIRVPARERLVPVDSSNCRFVTVEDICLANMEKICRGMNLKKAYPFRVTRNIKLTIEDDTFGEIDYLLDYVVDECRRRRGASATRLEVLANTPEPIVTLLTKELGLDETDVYEVQSNVLDLESCIGLAFVPMPALRETIREPVVPSAFKGLFERLQTKPGAIFDVIKKKDVLVEYPKETFQNSAALFLHAAARDPHVRSIKTALYRCGSKSHTLNALGRAAKIGKEVTVLVELKASFDEVQNSEYARDLQLAGCNVVYGVVGLMVHSKAIMVVREQPDGSLQTFSNVLTGNYNSSTANLYTDLSLYTCRESIADELHDVFNSLTGYSSRSDYETLLVAPVSMLPTFVQLIRKEAANAREGKPARIACHMNGLTDKSITKELYDASQADVKSILSCAGLAVRDLKYPARATTFGSFRGLGRSYSTVASSTSRTTGRTASSSGPPTGALEIYTTALKLSSLLKTELYASEFRRLSTW